MTKNVRYIFLFCILLSGYSLFSQTDRPPSFRFGLIADVQYANRDNHGTRNYRNSLAKLGRAVKIFNDGRVDFVVSLGDFINDDFNSFDTLNTITSGLQMPLYHVVGNHEFVVEDDKKDLVVRTLGMKNDYYAFEVADWCFIVLNGNDYSLISNIRGSQRYNESKAMLDKLKASGARNTSIYAGAVGEDQMNWLKRTLSEAAKQEKQVIILCHFPLYPKGSPKVLWNASALREVIDAYAVVRAYLNGHVHVSEYFLENGVHYVSFKGMVENDGNAFAIISVYDDHIAIKGYGKEVDRILPWR